MQGSQRENEEEIIRLFNKRAAIRERNEWREKNYSALLANTDRLYLTEEEYKDYRKAYEEELRESKEPLVKAKHYAQVLDYNNLIEVKRWKEVIKEELEHPWLNP